jgi:hypothetical protein
MEAGVRVSHQPLGVGVVVGVAVVAVVGMLVGAAVAVAVAAGVGVALGMPVGMVVGAAVPASGRGGAGGADLTASFGATGRAASPHWPMRRASFGFDPDRIAG